MVSLRSLIPLLLAAAVEAGAQGRLIPRPCVVPVRPEVAAPRCPPTTSAVVRTRSDVRVELVDRVLRYEIEERFVNRGGLIGEADYLFPLPKGAAFQDLKLSIDGEMVAGETLGADEARRIYEEIVRRQRDPALVEWMGQGLLRTRIFPIQPGEERRIVVRLQAVAEREGDAWRVDWSRGRMEVDARRAGGPPQQQGIPDPRIERNPNDASRIPRTQTSFTLTYAPGDELGAAYSPTHELTARDRGGRRTVEVRGEGGDITILIPRRAAAQAAVSLLAHAPGGEDAFALVTLTPPAVRGEQSPRDVTFVVDVSGSMSGRKLEQARAAGRQLLATLRPRDRFRIIDFGSDVRTMRDAFVPATRDHLREAERYLDDLEASGSTNIAGALDEALRGEAADGRLSLVLFLTDGEPTVGERDPQAIAARVARRRGDRRLFTFGIGAELNVALLEQLAVEGRGTAQFVRPDESVERTVALVASRLVDPVVTDLRVRGDGEVRLAKMHPSQPVDLFAGQDLVLLARVQGSGRARLHFEGRSRGAPVQWTHEVRIPERERANAFVARLWATQRVGWLSAERRRGATAELDAELRALGERFGIPTELTSYFVREPGMVANAAPGVVGRVGGVRIRGQATQLEAVVTTGTGAASAPPAVASTERFEAAKTAAAQRAATSMSVADSVSAIPDAASGVRTQRVGARTFIQDASGRWRDTRITPAMRIVQVRVYSKAWFALAQAIPELREVFAVGDAVSVAGRAVVIETGATGQEEMPEPALRDILRVW